MAILFGDRRVEEFIDARIEARDGADAADRQFVRTLTPSSAADLEKETKQLFARLQGIQA